MKELNVQIFEVNIDKIFLANSFFHRFIGLMGHKKTNELKGLLINRCNSIHTCFMHYPLDVLYLNKNNKVMKVYYCVAPWRVLLPQFQTVKVLEVEAGLLPKNLKKYDEVQLKCIN